VIIDVLARVRPRGYGSDKYQLDYDALALQHPFSIPFDSDAPFGLGDGDEA
jgi:hypothetical protein